MPLERSLASNASNNSLPRASSLKGGCRVSRAWGVGFGA